MGVLGEAVGVPGEAAGSRGCPHAPHPVAEVPGSSRRAVREGALVLSRLEPNDTLVAQCEAHNRHGRLLANAFVYVVGAWRGRGSRCSPTPPPTPQTGTPVPAATGGRPRGDGGVPAATASPSHGVPPTAGQRMWSPIPPHPRRATAFPPPYALATASPPWQPHPLRGNRISVATGSPPLATVPMATPSVATATGQTGPSPWQPSLETVAAQPALSIAVPVATLLPRRWRLGVPVAVAMAVSTATEGPRCHGDG